MILYQVFIAKLKSMISALEAKQKLTQEQINKRFAYIQSLEIMTNLLMNMDLINVDLGELRKILNYLSPELISKNDAEKILSTLRDLSVMQSLLKNKETSIKLKEKLLSDLRELYVKLNQLMEKLKETLPKANDNELLEEYRFYLSIVSEQGFTKIISREERLKFFQFLQSNKFGDNSITLRDYGPLIMCEYIDFAYKFKMAQRQKIEKETISKEEETIQEPILEEPTVDTIEQQRAKELEDLIKDIDTKLKKMKKKREPIFRKIQVSFLGLALSNHTLDQFNLVKDNLLTEEDIKKRLLLEHEKNKDFDITYEEILFYRLFLQCEEDLMLLQAHKPEELAGRDYDETKEILQEILNKINKMKSIDIKEDKEEKPKQVKQYQYGESIVLFFRNESSARSLFEEDINSQHIDEESNTDIRSILQRISNTDGPGWGLARRERDHFKAPISYNSKTGGKGEAIKIKSNYSGKEYDLFRLKGTGKTNPRISVFDIIMCDENCEKLNLPTNKHVILIIGEKQVTKYPQESQDYSYLIKEYRNNQDQIRVMIEKLENPATPKEELEIMFNESSDIYSEFVGTDRSGLVAEFVGQTDGLVK